MPTTDLRSVRRARDDRKVAGVAGGLARTLGVEAVIVRLAFVVLALSTGVGVVLYAVAWLALPEEREDEPSPAPVDRKEMEQAIGVGLVTLGLMLLLRRVGLFLPDQVVWPVALIGVGVAVAWSRAGGFDLDTERIGASFGLRVGAGAVLVAIGVGTFLAIDSGVVVGGRVLLAVLVTVGGIGVLAAPWILALVRQLGEERVERVRQAERAEMAAHLHDSVLQTLALIQRNADSPRETIKLARRQERELRSWLFGVDRSAPTSMASALRSMVDDVEEAHPVKVELVTVGDVPMGPAVAALVAAAGEATRNAALHAGVTDVSVYGELVGDELAVYVRDRGIGFDETHVDPERRGVRESIIGRMRRHGGIAEIHSAPGEGTEVTLRLPVRDLEQQP